MKVWVTGYRLCGFSVVGVALLLLACNGVFEVQRVASVGHHAWGELCVAALCGVAGLGVMAYAVASNVALTSDRGIWTARRGFIEWTSCRGYSWGNFHGPWMSSDYISLIVEHRGEQRRERISEVTTSPFGRAKVRSLVTLVESRGIARIP